MITMTDEIQVKARKKSNQLDDISSRLYGIQRRIEQWEKSLEKDNVDIHAEVRIMPDSITYHWFNGSISTDTLRIMSVIEVEKLKIELAKTEEEYKEILKDG